MNNTIAVIVAITILFLAGLGLYHVLPGTKKTGEKQKNIYLANPVYLSEDHGVSYGSLLPDAEYRSVNGLVYPYDRFFKEYPNNPWNLYKPGHVYNDNVALKHLSNNSRKHRRH